MRNNKKTAYELSCKKVIVSLMPLWRFILVTSRRFHGHHPICNGCCTDRMCRLTYCEIEALEGISVIFQQKCNYFHFQRFAKNSSAKYRTLRCVFVIWCICFIAFDMTWYLRCHLGLLDNSDNDSRGTNGWSWITLSGSMWSREKKGQCVISGSVHSFIKFIHSFI